MINQATESTLNRAAALGARDREIVALRAQGLTLRAIGERFALSRQRIAQILDQAAAHTLDDPAAAQPTRERPPVTGQFRQADQRPRSPSLTPEVPAESQAGVAERRAHARDLLAEGLPPSEIAARLDCALTTVYADLAWIRAARIRHGSSRPW